MTWVSHSVPSANAQRLEAETPAGNVEHHLTAFADGDDSPSFKDVLDVINPLQHIPIIGTLYREITGDKPGALSRIVGGALYGGPIGMMLESFDAIIDDQTGKDVGEHVLALLTGDDDDEAPTGDTKMAEQQDKTPDAKVADATANSATQKSAADAAEPPILAAGPQPLVNKEALADKLAVPANPAPPLAPAQTVNTDQPLSARKFTTTASAQNPTAANAATQATASDTPKGGLPRGFMAVPERHNVPVAPLAPAQAQISSSGQMSNIPVAGKLRSGNALPRDAIVPGSSQIAQAPVSRAPADGQTALTAQQIALMNQPLPGASGTSAAKPAAVPQQWVPSAMAAALEKYERMSKIGRAPASDSPSSDTVQ